jgi:glycosyltransferase involved in cell wall biosynthesis
MTSSPKISILMSCFNSEETVQKSINSILQQSYDEFEFLIMDDNSTDNTFNIIKENAKIDTRIRYFRNEINLGLTKSLNKLIEHSKGSFIARQDADDISLKERLEIQIEFLKSSSNRIVTTRAVNIDSRKIHPGFSYYLPKNFVIKYKNPFIHGTLMIEKSLLINMGGYDKNFYFSQDYKLFYDCLVMGYKVPIIKKVLYKLNMKDNLSNKFKNEQRYYSDCVRKNILPNKLSH